MISNSSVWVERDYALFNTYPFPPVKLGAILKPHNSERHMYFSVHCSTIYNSQDMEATWVHQQMNG